MNIFLIRKAPQLTVAIATLILAACGEDEYYWPVFWPKSLEFDLQDTVKYLNVNFSNKRSYEWQVVPSEPWLLVHPQHGSTWENTFRHEIRVEANVQAGIYRGELTVRSKFSREDQFEDYDQIRVTAHRGALIERFVIEQNQELDSLFSCSDSNAASGSDYWGVHKRNGDVTIWCNGRGIPVQEGHYDDNMSAWMTLKPVHKVALTGFDRIHLGFWLYGSIHFGDYLEVVVHDPVGRAHADTLQRARWWGRFGYYNDRQPQAVSLEWFDEAGQSDSLQFSFVFRSDLAVKDCGVFISDISVFGDAKE